MSEVKRYCLSEYAEQYTYPLVGAGAYVLASDYDKLLERVADLEAQLVGYDKLSRDANRYRWFRWNAAESFYGNEIINLVNDPVSLDRAIDAAMAGGGE